MTKKYMERIEALRQQYLSTRVDMDVYNAKYVTEGFKETEGQPWIIPVSYTHLGLLREGEP